MIASRDTIAGAVVFALAGLAIKAQAGLCPNDASEAGGYRYDTYVKP